MRDVRPLLCALIALLLCAPARAEQCRPIEGGSPDLAAADAQRRLEFVHQSLMEDAARTRAWWIAWVSFLAVADAAQIAGAIVAAKVPVPPNNGFPRFILNSVHFAKDPLIVGSITTAGALIGLAVVPPPVLADGPALDLQLTSDPLTNRCVLLANGERMLLRAASEEAEAHGWIPHVTNAAVNLAASLVIGIAFHQWLSAAIGLALGVSIGEILIYTEPSYSQQALVKYRAGDFGPVSASQISVEAQGLSLTLRF